MQVEFKLNKATGEKAIGNFSHYIQKRGKKFVILRYKGKKVQRRASSCLFHHVNPENGDLTTSKPDTAVLSAPKPISRAKQPISRKRAATPVKNLPWTHNAATSVLDKAYIIVKKGKKEGIYSECMARRLHKEYSDKGLQFELFRLIGSDTFPHGLDL